MTTKTQLIDYMAEKYGMPKSEAHREINAVWEAMEDILLEDDGLRTTFGVFKINEIGERHAVYTMGDKKGEPYIVPAHKRVSFKASKPIRDTLKG